MTRQEHVTNNYLKENGESAISYYKIQHNTRVIFIYKPKKH